MLRTLTLTTLLTAVGCSSHGADSIMVLSAPCLLVDAGPGEELRQAELQVPASFSVEAGDTLSITMCYQGCADAGPLQPLPDAGVTCEAANNVTFPPMGPFTVQPLCPHFISGAATGSPCDPPATAVLEITEH